MTLAKYIKMERLERGLTQSQLAQKLEVNESFIGLMERGTSKIPLDKLKRLIKILKLNKAEVIRAVLNETERKLLEELL